MTVISARVFKSLNHTGTKLKWVSLKMVIPVIILVLTSAKPISPEPNVDFSAPENETNFKFKSLYCWKFIKFIEWPSTYQQGDFEIEILGDSPIQKYFEEWQVGRKVNLQNIKVKKVSSPSSVQKPHIIYIPSERSKDIGTVVKKLAGKSSLIITEKEGMANQGSMINFIVVNSRVRFEINKGNASKFNLLVSSSLLELSTKVYDK